MSRCPFCTKEIAPRAWHCRHCGEYLEGRQVLWLEYLAEYQAASRSGRKLLMQRLDLFQQAFFAKLLSGKYDRWLSEKPKRFTVRPRTLRAFAAVSVIASLLAILGASFSIYARLEPLFSHAYLGRSARFDVPLPQRAQLLNLPRGISASVASFREGYAAPGSAEILFLYFDEQLSAEGWARFGTREGGKQVYRKGQRWLGLIIPPQGGGFTLTAPPR